MSRFLIARAIFLAALAFSSAAAAQTPSGDWQAVEKGLGRAGTAHDGVYRVTFPRTDLRVRVSGASIRPALALTSWAAFEKAGPLTTMMGDLVLLSSEVEPVITKLSQADFEITAVHNHLLGELPRLLYVHYDAQGDAGQLAATLRGALALTATPLGPAPPRAARQSAAGLDAAPIEKILGRKGTINGGVLSFTIARAEKIKCCGAENDALLLYSGVPLGPPMGVASGINFEADGSGTVTAGDLVLLGSEVRLVIRALREYGIEVVALHSHMLDEQPRLFFLHFWGRGQASQLAQGLRAALERTNSARER